MTKQLIFSILFITTISAEPTMYWEKLTPETFYAILIGWQEEAIGDGGQAYEGSSFGIWDNTKQTYVAGGVVEDNWNRKRYVGEKVCAWGDRKALMKVMGDQSFDETVPECSSIKRPGGLDYKQVGVDWLEVVRYVNTRHGEVGKFKVLSGERTK